MADRSLEIVAMNDPASVGLDPSVLAIGDRVLEVAGRPAEDPLDFVFHSAHGRAVRIKVERKDGRIEDIVIPTDAVAGLSIFFQPMDFRRCRCKCPFCFVDQNPGGMRESLAVKDEDFRLSFLYGNFTTMNDITDDELAKIIEQKNSPQWVSVHAIDEAVRRFIFGRPMKRDIVETLRTLAGGGITVHTQAVLVPGKNDGEYLRETIEVLEAIHPNVATLAVVPVGLTKHRAGLSSIRGYRDDEMGVVIDLIEGYQRSMLSSRRRSRFAFPSDEWYMGAAREIPAFDDYEGFPQLDNGVGSIRHFLHDIEEDVDGLTLPADLGSARVVTGALGRQVFKRHVLPLLTSCGVEVLPELVTVTNDFYGETVTCSGLLVGRDMVTALRAAGEAADRVTFLPPNCLNYDGVTIDEMTPADIAREIGGPVVVPADSFVAALADPATAVPEAE